MVASMAGRSMQARTRAPAVADRSAPEGTVGFSGGGKRWLLAWIIAVAVSGCDLNPRPEDPTSNGDNGASGAPAPGAGGSGSPLTPPPTHTADAGTSIPGTPRSADAGTRDAGADAGDADDANDAALSR
jgi:hypothetical protein